MQKRITVFDTIRGFTMLSMAGFHACYDLAYLYVLEDALVYPDHLPRHLASQHQLGIFVYCRLDVHPLAQQHQACRQISRSRFGRMGRNDARLSR